MNYNDLHSEIMQINASEISCMRLYLNKTEIYHTSSVKLRTTCVCRSPHILLKDPGCVLITFTKI